MIRCRNCGERPASEGHICMVCKRRSDIDPYKALIAMALFYCGVAGGLLQATLCRHRRLPATRPAAEAGPARRQATLEQRGI